MSNILIAYASKTGTTKKCAELLAEQLPGAHLLDLTHVDFSQETQQVYDMIIVGGSIRMNKLHAYAHHFLSENHDALLHTPFACFICNATIEGAPQELKQNIPSDLLKKAIFADTFGGDMDLKKHKYPEKFIAKIALNSLKKQGITPPSIQKARIEKAAQAVQKALSSPELETEEHSEAVEETVS